MFYFKTQDHGDHPPITPTAYATPEELGGGDAWRLYEFITKYFIATVRVFTFLRVFNEQK